MFFSLLTSELGVSSFTINLILFASITILLGLPTFFLIKSGGDKSAF